MISTVLHGIATPQARGIWQSFVFHVFAAKPYTVYCSYRLSDNNCVYNRERWTLCRHYASICFMLQATQCVASFAWYRIGYTFPLKYIVHRMYFHHCFLTTFISNIYTYIIYIQYMNVLKNMKIYIECIIYNRLYFMVDIWPYDRAHNKNNPYLL